MRIDPSSIEPVLAVGLAESERGIVRGATATFISYTNYPAFVARGEVRIFAADQAPDSIPLAIIAADEYGTARWQPDGAAPDALFYTYRVYDAYEGSFDETAAQELTLLDTPLAEAPPPRALFGSRDEARIRNIALSKAISVTVTGTTAPGDDLVRVESQLVPVDKDGRFAARQLVTHNQRAVRVIGQHSGLSVIRPIDRPRDEWFYVGQADLNFVSNRGTGAAIEVGGDPLAHGDNLHSRAAFYAKGAMANGMTITASLDTGETLLSDLFSNLDRKDPRQLLRRLDNSQHYPVYGDDSTLVEDAPTQGRFYLKVEKDKSHLLVGNFIADIDSAELVQLNRGTFGAIADHKSVATTSFGEKKLTLTAFAADPGTIPARDEFRGTGGSLYFLKRRDITIGSERLSIEVRDRDTGLSLSRRDLRPQEDYDVDYFQGRIVLLRPSLPMPPERAGCATAPGGGDIPVLVARYEYTPAVGDVTGYTLG
ncbi:MAG: hypothetical protein HC788_14195, partial [Sphingopyxis sp.]|nr:hypothetical protein [Sphingopyxis sp.]